MWSPRIAEQDVAAIGAECNGWLIGDDEEVIVIDPGDDAEAVLEQVGDREIVAVICTHGHERHVLAAVEVAERDEAPVALHRSDRLFWRMSHAAVQPEIEMAHGGRFEVADVAIEVIHTPGHTPGSVRLYAEALRLVLPGDTRGARRPVPHDREYPRFPWASPRMGGARRDPAPPSS